MTNFLFVCLFVCLFIDYYYYYYYYYFYYYYILLATRYTYDSIVCWVTLVTRFVDWAYKALTPNI